MTEWEPATEAEAALRDALRGNDQELYFRILSQIDLFLPVSAQALTGYGSSGWGTWTTAGRTHVLAFTSVSALQICLAEGAGATRSIAYRELATNWPNPQWWLAVNPGLPIEGYLPAWFVAQLAAGDPQLPARPVAVRSRLERAEHVARARAAVPARPPAERGQAYGEPPGAIPTSTATPGATQSGVVTAGAVPSPVASSVPPPSVPSPAPAADAPPVPRRPAAPAASTFLQPTEQRSDHSPDLGQVKPDLAGEPETASPGPSPSGPVEPVSPSGPVEPVSATGIPAKAVVPPDFRPANEVEQDLLDAVLGNNQDTFLSTLLLARVLLPLSVNSVPGSRPGQEGFVWRTERFDGETCVVVFTSPERMADHLPGTLETLPVKFAHLIRRWPENDWSLAVNPGTPVGTKLPGAQIMALANWAAEMGLGDDGDGTEATPPSPAAEGPAGARYEPVRADPNRPVMMQKAITTSQVAYYLDRGYDRVSGFVHRVSEISHIRTPAKLYATLGLGYPNSPFDPEAREIYVLRWPAHRPSLYRIPYGGQSEAAMRAMEGWVIERPPFRGNGFAPAESGEIIAEFKVDSVRLPHGAQLCRLRADGVEELIATLDTDLQAWRRVGAP